MHLWQSLIAVLRRPRPEATSKYNVSGLSVNNGIGVKVDEKTIRQNADGELSINISGLRTEQEALQAMVVTLQNLVKNTKKVQPCGTYEMVDDEGVVR